jgi:hypothetical protein
LRWAGAGRVRLALLSFLALRLGSLMAFDNFTIRKYRALQECPQGQQPGQVFEATEDAGDILVLVGAAERLPDDYEKKKDKPTYRRRDLRAES